MIGFKLDTNGDLSLDSNKKWPLLKTYAEAVKQRLQIKMRSFRGEWFLDTSFGIPYRDTGDGRAIIGKGYSKQEVDAIYLSEIRQDPDVTGIKYFVSNYNPINRMYDLNFEVTTIDGDLRVDAPSLYAWQEVTYEYNPSALRSACDIDLFGWSDELHPIVHEDLPAGGQYTWITN